VGTTPRWGRCSGDVRNLAGRWTLGVQSLSPRRIPMDGIIYIVGLIVVVLAILSFFGLR
jgi:hypothetical protein